MWNKTLWRREYRQARWLIWIFPIVHFFLLGMQRLNTWVLDDPNTIQFKIDRITSIDSPRYYTDFISVEDAGPRFILTAILFVLALIVIGAERRNGTQEFLFSLPYTRRLIFATKWLIGVVVIIFSVVLNHLLDVVIVLSSPIAEYINYTYHFEQALYTWLFLSAMYALALFIGSICGSIASQSIFSFIVFVLPVGLHELIRDWLSVHHIKNSYSAWKFVDEYNLLSYMFLNYYSFSLIKYVVIALLFFIASFAGILFYERNKTEDNGKLVIFPVWEIVIQIGFVLCFSLLLGSILSGLFMNAELFWHYFGLLIGFILGSWIILRLSRVRLKI